MTLTRALTAAAATTATALAALAVAGTAMAATPAHHPAPRTTAPRTTAPLNCAAAPSACGYPDATNTGVPAGTTLKSVPAQVSSGPGWTWDAAYGEVIVKTDGTVLAGLYIPGALDIQASHVTVRDVQAWGIGLRHTTDVTIEDSTIKGENATSGRVNQAIGDVYDDSTGIVIKDDNISNFRVAIQARTGLIEGNYIHNPGYIPGDHTDGIMATGSAQPMTITGNTIFINLGQCYAISLNAAPGTLQPVADKTVTGNFLAGGDYPLYAGNGWNDPTSNITITGNRFGQQFFPQSGEFGPTADYDPTGTGNTWTANIWDTTGQDLPA